MDCCGSLFVTSGKLANAPDKARSLCHHRPYPDEGHTLADQHKQVQPHPLLLGCSCDRTGKIGYQLKR